jgi:hypothetical protein
MEPIVKQTRKHSLFEASLNTASGFVISIIAGEVIFPLLGWPVSHTQNLEAVSLFTVISIVRSYFWRRAFNWWHHKEAKPR